MTMPAARTSLIRLALPALAVLVLAVLATAGVDVYVVSIEGKKYIVVNASAAKSYSLNFTFVALSNSSGVYVITNPPTQAVSCYAGGTWYNGTGVVRMPPGSTGVVCFFRGFDYGFAVTPIAASKPPPILAPYAQLLSLAVAAGAVMWRRLEVAGIYSIAMGLALPFLYPVFGMEWNQAFATSLILFAVGALLVVVSMRGE